MIDSTKLLFSKLDDLIISLSKGKDFAFTNFLSENEFLCALGYLKHKLVNISAYGGYHDSQRKMISLYNDLDYEINFPIVPVAFKIPFDAQIAHSDVLGALLSLGVKREHVGDIIFVDDLCIFFVTDKISDFIILNLTSVRNIGVAPENYYGDITYTQSFIELNITVNSMRIDCIVSSLTGVSRTASEQMIISGLVYLNGVAVTKKDKLLGVGDVLSIRKKGKYIIKESAGLTKKGRIKIKVLKYN